MYRIVVILSTVAAVCVGCGADERPAPVAAPPSRLDLGVVGVEARIGDDAVSSSGIVVNASAGLVVTTAHTVWGAHSLKLATQLGILHGRIVARAPCDDLALVETYPRIPGLVAPALAPDSSPAQGDSLRTVGRRRTDPGALGLLSIPSRAAGAPGPAVVDARLPQQQSAVALDSPLVPELAGGPVLDQAGRLAGMAIPRTSGDGLVIPWRTIRQRLSELKPGPRELYVGWRDQYRCVNQLHRYERALHPGFRARDARLDAPVPATRVPGTEALNG
jgi:S1-C subfamily serine protease